MFFGPIGKTRWPPWPLIGWDIFDFSSEPLNGIQENLTGSKISTSSTKFVFFGPIGKTRWPPWPLIVWDISDFSSETAERNSTKLDRKQDLNLLYQVCVFRADRKNKMAVLANRPKRWHIVLRCTICGPLGLLFISILIMTKLGIIWWKKRVQRISDLVTYFWNFLKLCYLPILTLQMYSCGSLAPKMGRGSGGGCMDHKFRKPPEPWELADG